MKIRKGFQSNRRASQLGSTRVFDQACGGGSWRPSGLARERRAAGSNGPGGDDVTVSDSSGGRGARPRFAASSGVAWPEATEAHICTMMYSAATVPAACVIGPLYPDQNWFSVPFR